LLIEHLVSLYDLFYSKKTPIMKSENKQKKVYESFSSFLYSKNCVVTKSRFKQVWVNSKSSNDYILKGVRSTILKCDYTVILCLIWELIINKSMLDVKLTYNIKSYTGQIKWEHGKNLVKWTLTNYDLTSECDVKCLN